VSSSRPFSSFAQAPTSPPAPPRLPHRALPLNCPPTPAVQVLLPGLRAEAPHPDSDGGMGDMAISPPIETSIMGSAMVEVVNANTQNAEYICSGGK